MPPSRPRPSPRWRQEDSPSLRNQRATPRFATRVAHSRTCWYPSCTCPARKAPVSFACSKASVRGYLVFTCSCIRDTPRSRIPNGRWRRAATQLSPREHRRPCWCVRFGDSRALRHERAERIRATPHDRCGVDLYRTTTTCSGPSRSATGSSVPGSRGARCLIFQSPEAVRRVWDVSGRLARSPDAEPDCAELVPLMSARADAPRDEPNDSSDNVLRLRRDERGWLHCSA